MEWKKIATVTFLLAGVIACSPTHATEPEFSWHSLVGSSPASFTSALERFSKCSGFVSHGFDLPLLFAHTKVSDDLDRPVGGSLFPNDPVRFKSASITVVDCNVGEKAVIRGYSHAGRVFKIVVRYIRCKFECVWDEQPFDHSLYETFGKKGGYELSRDVEDYESTYHFIYRSQLSDSYFAQKIGDAAFGCWPGRNPSYNTNLLTKCLVAGTVEQNRWQSVSMLEIYEDGLFSDTFVARVAIRQEFTLIPAEETALAVWFDEVSEFVRTRRAESAAEEARDAAEDQMLGTTD